MSFPATPFKYIPSKESRTRAKRRQWLAVVAALFALSVRLAAQENADCLACHEDKTLTGTRGGKKISLFVEQKTVQSSVHGSLQCIACHAGLAGKEMPHEVPVAAVQCGACHDGEEKLQRESLHHKAAERGDNLAPTCATCHGNHDIVSARDRRSPVAPLNIPYLCGRCHQEGTKVSRERNIPQHEILANYSESIHGEGLLRKGLIVAPSCASCHSAHFILPHTDSRSSISRKNIATTCAKCHAQIELVHRKVIKGELWEKEANKLPACIDCHQPHKVRKVFYSQGMADADCMRCHQDANVTSSVDGRSLTVNQDDVQHSMHGKTACSQCHSEVNASRRRACETIKNKVDCASCHAEVGGQYQTSMHGLLTAKNDLNGPTCKECHGTHAVLGRRNPGSPIFPTNIPDLCAKCHQEGKKAAMRYTGSEHEIIKRYTESIHGKGLLKSGLTVTATCTDCHTAHSVQPQASDSSSVNPRNLPATCGRCHHGIQEQFLTSVHAKMVGKTAKQLPVCNDCHSAHTIRRTDADGFRLDIMQKCGRCHEKIAATYFDTYHGKVTQLGYTKTAKCYDCHGAHDILPIADPKSHLSHDNVVQTCQKCHAGASRRFAGYLTHATHHDPEKYPFLFWTFWGMTGLLVGTFFISGVHTLLWLPRALRMKRERRREQAKSIAKGSE